MQGTVECFRGCQTQMLLMQYGQSLVKESLYVLQMPPYLQTQAPNKPWQNQ